MAKNLRTSDDYTILAGTGAAGTKDIVLDSRKVVVKGDLDVEGTNTVIDTTSLTIEDPILILSRNNSTPSDIDAGILINRGAANNAAIYWNEGDDVFKAVTTTSDGTGNAIVDTALAKIQAAEPAAASDVATKNYVDTNASSFSLRIAGDDSAQVAITTNNTLQFTGANGISTAATEPDTITISLGRDLNGIDTISTDRSNQDLTLTSNGTGAVVIDDVLSFSGMASDPTATAQTKIYNKTAGGGGTGLYFRNSNIASGVVGELISKSKATALAIALG
tara:strand:+ start:715 stop:1548 length:834 start_codon:yes stop_codon:yes gene_type:complete